MTTPAGDQSVPPLKPMSLRAFGRMLGVSDMAVRKAIAAGRIPAAAVGRNGRGQPVLVNVELALAGWDSNRAKSKKPNADESEQTLVEVQRQVGEQRARRLLFDNDLREGAYVRVVDAQREAFERARVIREGLLNLPSRLAPELAAESDAQRVFERLDTEIRAALEAAADALELPS